MVAPETGLPSASATRPTMVASGSSVTVDWAVLVVSRLDMEDLAELSLLVPDQHHPIFSWCEGHHVELGLRLEIRFVAAASGPAGHLQARHGFALKIDHPQPYLRTRNPAGSPDGQLLSPRSD